MMEPCPHPYVNEYVRWPNELTLYFAGDTICYAPFWGWAIMDATDLYASDRGHVPTKVHRTNIWAATVGLGKGCAFLGERKWAGKLVIKSHLRDCGIFQNIRASDVDQMIQRCWRLLDGIKWTAKPITGDENEFARGLVRQAYKEWGDGK